MIGPAKRVPTRRGRPVTQEEIAEVLRVSRGYYRMLEGGAKLRPSVQLLDRLAQVLSLSADERRTLFALGVPEINRTQIHADTGALLEAFSWLRAVAKRLWVANSEADMYVQVSEAMISRFDEAAAVHWMRRSDAGIWERHCLANRGPKTIYAISDEYHRAMRRSEIDQLMLYPRFHEPGSVGTSEHVPLTPRRIRDTTFATHGLVAPDFIHGRVRSRDGHIGGLAVLHPKGWSYSATDCAILGGLADLTSLALS